MCVPCGAKGQLCCGGSICDGGNVCQAGACGACGAVGQPCCNGSVCTDVGSACVNGTCVALAPVGRACTKAGQCGGPYPQCYTTIPSYNWSAAGGYCSNSGCTNDQGCGAGGFCDTASGLCFQSCMAKGDCAANNPNNVCFFIGPNLGCAPKSASQCDPTVAASCGANGACLRTGADDVGFCTATCMLGGACPNDPKGNAQSCIYFPYPGQFIGLACVQPGMAAPGGQCMYLNECVDGYECSTTKHVCAQLCQAGTTACASGTCQNDFMVMGFGNGSIGLCL
jgi:hypothetical protein